MIYSVTGALVCTTATYAVVECGGVGFKCYTTLNTLKQLGPSGSKVTLLTHMSVREDAMDLFGFFEAGEMECFRLLIGVSGIGPKAAMAILSELTPDKLALCIATGDSKTITRAPGVGKKTAERIVLELKDKMASGFTSSQVDSSSLAAAASASELGNSAEAVSALVALGFVQSDAAVVVSKMPPELPVEEMIRRGLKELARQV